MKPTLEIIIDDCRRGLTGLDRRSIQTCVTSPPYWALRDYGHSHQLGFESTPREYANEMVRVFWEVRRVLKIDGTAWLNIGDTFVDHSAAEKCGLRPKNLAGIPWRTAFALQADGWILRSDVIWSKATCMPDDRKDRPARSHEYIFLLTKHGKYYYNADAIRVRSLMAGRYVRPDSDERISQRGVNAKVKATVIKEWRARRSVWRIPVTSSFRWPVNGDGSKEVHFACFPEGLPKLCILAGSRVGDCVLDPFAGSGTVGQVALRLGRSAVLCEANPDYIRIIRRRCQVWKMEQIGELKWRMKKDFGEEREKENGRSAVHSGTDEGIS
jgi:DNA modification methylase